jgi:hypothetical protein
MSAIRLFALFLLLATAMTNNPRLSAAAEPTISPEHRFGDLRRATGPGYFAIKAQYLAEIYDSAWKTRNLIRDPWDTRLAAIAVIDEVQDKEKWKNNTKTFCQLLRRTWGQSHITPKSEVLLYRADVTKLVKGSPEHTTLVEVGALSRGFLFEVLKKHTPDTLFAARAATLKKDEEWSQADRETAFMQAQCLASRALALAGDDEALGCLVVASQLNEAEQRRICVAAECLRHIGTPEARSALAGVPAEYRSWPARHIDEVLLQLVDILVKDEGNVFLTTEGQNYLELQDYCYIYRIASRTSPYLGRWCAVKNGNGRGYEGAVRVGMLKVLEPKGEKLLCRVVSPSFDVFRRQIEAAAYRNDPQKAPADDKSKPQ